MKTLKILLALSLLNNLCLAETVQSEEARQQIRERKQAQEMTGQQLSDTGETIEALEDQVEQSQAAEETYQGQLNAAQGSVDQSNADLKAAKEDLKQKRKALKELQDRMARFIREQEEAAAPQVDDNQEGSQGIPDEEIVQDTSPQVEEMKASIERQVTEVQEASARLEQASANSQSSEQQKRIVEQQLKETREYLRQLDEQVQGERSLFESLSQQLKSQKRLGVAKPCSKIRSGQKKYECYKSNIKTAHENVFGFLKNKIKIAKDLAEHSDDLIVKATACAESDAGDSSRKSLCDKGINKINELCGKPGDPAVSKKFLKKFCRRGKIKRSLREFPGQLLKLANDYKDELNKNVTSAQNRFKREFKNYKAQAEWFAINFMKRLQREKGEVGDCISNTYMRTVGPDDKPSECFYSSLDMAACFASTTNKNNAPDMVLYGTGNSNSTALFFSSGIGQPGQGRIVRCDKPIVSQASAKGTRRRYIQVRSSSKDPNGKNSRLKAVVKPAGE